MVYITGDKHGDYDQEFEFCYKNNTSKNDIMIILGDAGINYDLDSKDYTLKNYLKELPITLFCIHGNHEERPYNIAGYKSKYLMTELYIMKKIILIYCLPKMVKYTTLMGSLL